MSNIGGNYSRVAPLTESRALSRARTNASMHRVGGVEIGPESGNPGEGDMRGRLAAPGTGGSAMSAATSAGAAPRNARVPWVDVVVSAVRSEEHTSELQSRENLVCRLLLEKKKINNRPR